MLGGAAGVDGKVDAIEHEAGHYVFEVAAEHQNHAIGEAGGVDAEVDLQRHGLGGVVWLVGCRVAVVDGGVGDVAEQAHHQAGEGLADEHAQRGEVVAGEHGVEGVGRRGGGEHCFAQGGEGEDFVGDGFEAEGKPRG